MEELFKRWECAEKHVGVRFIRDGILHEDKWENNSDQGKPRILFVLKECYGNFSDLRIKIRDSLECDHHTWWNCAIWAYGIQEIFKNGNPPMFPGWEREEWVYKEMPEVREALLSSAVINLKKSKGESKSTKKDLLDYAIEDKIFIREQVDLINPNIIICGHTWPVLKEANVFNAESKRISDWIHKLDGKTFVDYWHPQQRRSPKIDYYALTSAIYHWKQMTISKLPVC